MTGVGGKVFAGTTLVATGFRSDRHPSKLLATNVNSAASSRTSVSSNAPATPYSVGSWVQVASSLPAASDSIVILPDALTYVSGADTSAVLEIATGGSGSEVLWARVAVGYSAVSLPITVPGYIASGTRVSVRLRSARASLAFSAYYSFTTAKDLSCGAPITWGGANMATTAYGVTLTGPGSINTKGAWTEIVASTSAAVSQLLIGAQCGGTTAQTMALNLVDIAVGGSGSETVIVGDLCWQTHGNEFIAARQPLTYGVDIPAGSRISARYAASATGSVIDLILVGA